MAAVTVTLARTTIGDTSELAIAGLAGVAAVRGISGGWIVLFGLVLGALIHLVRS
jgi:hypothetical protein